MCRTYESRTCHSSVHLSRTFYLSDCAKCVMLRVLHAESPNPHRNSKYGPILEEPLPNFLL
jgi:hypothetical protein